LRNRDNAERKPTILKLGGSAITEKGTPLTPSMSVIRRLAREVSEAEVSPLILIHGGGSFGHPLAEKYRLKEGFRDPSQLVGFSKTHEAMVSLNKLVVEALIEEGIPAFGMPPSSFTVTRMGRVYGLEDKPIRMAIDLGLVPILYGDVTLDLEKGFAILSGDQIAALLAVRLGAERIIMGVDVDGLYTEDPKLNPSARLIQHLTIKDLEEIWRGIRGSSSPDVTGGMMGKILELIPPIKRGAKALIVNALKPRNVYKALKGEPGIGTEITKE